MGAVCVSYSPNGPHIQTDETRAFWPTLNINGQKLQWLCVVIQKLYHIFVRSPPFTRISCKSSQLLCKLTGSSTPEIGQYIIYLPRAASISSMIGGKTCHQLLLHAVSEGRMAVLGCFVRTCACSTSSGEFQQRVVCIGSNSLPKALQYKLTAPQGTKHKVTSNDRKKVAVFK